MGQGFSRMLQSISNDYLAPNQIPMKTSYNGFKEESIGSARSSKKQRPGSSIGGREFRNNDLANMHVDEIETDAASKMLPSINKGKP